MRRAISGDLIWSRPNQAGWPDMVRLISGDLIWPGSYQVKLSQMAGRARKKQFFSGFLSVFRPVFCIFTNNIYNKKIFWKKIGPSLLFVVAGATDTNVRRSTGVTTANSTNIRNTNQLGDQLPNHRPAISVMFNQKTVKRCANQSWSLLIVWLLIPTGIT